MDQDEKMDALARDVLKLSRDTLLVNLRFMDAALSQFEEVPYHGTLATDGHHLAYDARYILRRYKEDFCLPVRDYLHVVLHCVFRHMFVNTLVDRDCWNLACDIAVENTIGSLHLSATTVPRERQQEQVLSTLRSELSLITAEKLYRYFLDKHVDSETFTEWSNLFYADDHTPWYEVTPTNGGQPSVQNKTDKVTDIDSTKISAQRETSMEDVWKNISLRMQTDLETFGKQRGTDAGGLIQSLQAVNREKYDYAEFLKKFAVRQEVMKTNDDEFDYIFYTYGLRLYENMPLIEPLEYKEEKRIREFAIAIDTSGSTSGELVQRFIQKTYNILMSTESFFSKINVHIIQCDAKIQEDAKITSQREFEEYLKTMEIHGLGGTDFRPVFEYVNSLEEKKEFTNLRGLIYFTDGHGTFPAQKPDYDAVFVFLENGNLNADVPPWAMKLILQDNEI